MQRILLGGELRALRNAAKISATEAATALSWYRAKVSKVETGTVRVTAAELSELLKLYNVNDEATTERVQRLGEEARCKTSPARVLDWASKYVSLKADATEIKLFFGDFIPGMLQTGDYARAFLSASVVVPPADVEQMATNREHRAERLRSGAPLLWVVLGEEALRRTVGGRQVQRGQLLRLRELAELPNVTVQVMPLSGGAHRARHVVRPARSRLIPDCLHRRPHAWHKSSHSAGADNCVEVAHGPGWTAVRDSKNKTGPVLLFTDGEWNAFLERTTHPA